MFNKTRVFNVFSNLGPWDVDAIGYIGTVVVYPDDSAPDVLKHAVENWLVAADENGAGEVIVSGELSRLQDIIDENEISCYYEGDEEFFVVMNPNPDDYASIFTFVETINV